jgi:hypothetical protein
MSAFTDILDSAMVNEEIKITWLCCVGHDGGLCEKCARGDCDHVNHKTFSRGAGPSQVPGSPAGPSG